MRRLKALAIFNALAFIVNILFAAMSQSAVINTKTPWEIALKYETLLTPSPVIFGIWVILFTTLAIHCLYHIIMAYKHDKINPANDELSKMGLFFIILNLSAAGWYLAWTSERMLVALVLMFIQLISLVIIHTRLGIYKTSKAASVKVATQFPLSVYLGWVSVAFILNISSYFSSVGITPFGISALHWSVIMISFIILLSAFIILVKRNIYFGLIAAWILFGIVEKRELIDLNEDDGLISTAWAGIGIIVVLGIIQLTRNLKYRKPREIFPSHSLPLK